MVLNNITIILLNLLINKLLLESGDKFVEFNFRRNFKRCRR